MEMASLTRISEYHYFLFIIESLVSLAILIGCFTYYRKKYKFSGESIIFVTCLSLLFNGIMIYFGKYQIPFYIWPLLAFHFYIDFKYRDLPDGINILIALGAIPSVISHLYLTEPIFSHLYAGSVLFFIFFILAIIGTMGGGDIKMMGAVGLLFPLIYVPRLIIFGFTIGVIWGIILLAFRKVNLKSVFAFGPSLILGILLTCLW